MTPLTHCPGVHRDCSAREEHRRLEGSHSCQGRSTEGSTDTPQLSDIPTQCGAVQGPCPVFVSGIFDSCNVVIGGMPFTVRIITLNFLGDKCQNLHDDNSCYWMLLPIDAVFCCFLYLISRSQQCFDNTKLYSTRNTIQEMIPFQLQKTKNQSETNVPSNIQTHTRLKRTLI